MSFSNKCRTLGYHKDVEPQVTILKAFLDQNEHNLKSMNHLMCGLKMIAKSIPFIVFLVALAGCSVQRIQSNWALNSPTIDGNLDEWKGASFVVIRDAQVSVAVGNDSSFLYLGARIANTGIQRAIGQSGVTLWIDPGNGKEKNLEILFPALKAARTDLDRGGFWDGLSDEQKARAEAELKELGKGILVIDRRMVQSHLYKKGNAEGFAGVVIESQGLVSFEARIPLRIQKDFSESTEMHPGTSVTIGVGSGVTGGSSPGAPGFEGAPPMGEPGLSGSGGRRGNFSRGGFQNQENKEIWFEVGLAQPR